MRRLLLTLLLCGAASFGWGQSCTTAVCNAASPALTDVLAALPSSANTNASVVVNIPPGTATWTSALNYTVPAGVANPTAVTTLTIQGATTVNCTGTAGTSSYSCSATDSTTIIDGFTPSGQNQLIQVTTGGNSTTFRWTATTFKPNANAAKNNALLLIGGNSQNVRIDHNHFDENGQNDSMIQVVGNTHGVTDHNLFTLGDHNNVGNGFRDFASSDGTGDQAWASPTAWGTASGWWYLESNQFVGGSPTDCYNGAKLVIRYNTLTNIFVMALHGTKNDAGRGRSCRATEIYHNYASGSPNSDAVVGQNGGPSMIWGNNIASGFNRFNAPGAPRNFAGGDNCSGTQTWGGMAGTNVRNNPPTCSQSGTDAWDGNSSSATGYPVLDGVGRGQGNLINFSVPAWPSQMLEPEYMWMNTLAAANEGAINDQSSQYNRDVYPDCGNAGSACSGAFNGTQGTGFGTSRPSTCTAGPGGAFGTSPTGSYGVAYWHTDTNILDICTATNVWSQVYVPLAYPHPLAGGTSTPQALAPSVAPSTGTYTGTQTVTMVANTTGAAICYTIDNSTPTGNGAGVCTHGTLYGGPFTISATMTIKAMSTKFGFLDSTLTTVVITITIPTVANPTFSPTPATYATTQSVTLSDTTSGATIYYTLDGSNPTTSSLIYSTPISVSVSTTIKAFGFKTGSNDSAVVTGVYTISPLTCGDPQQLGPNFSDTYTSPPTTLPLSIGFSSPTAGCALHCLAGGATPTSSSPIVSFPILISTTWTERCIAAQPGYIDSQVIGGTWSINTVVVNAPTNLQGVVLNGVTIH